MARLPTSLTYLGLPLSTTSLPAGLSTLIALHGLSQHQPQASGGTVPPLSSGFDELLGLTSLASLELPRCQPRLPQQGVRLAALGRLRQLSLTHMHGVLRQELKLADLTLTLRM